MWRRQKTTTTLCSWSCPARDSADAVQRAANQWLGRTRREIDQACRWVSVSACPAGVAHVNRAILQLNLGLEWDLGPAAGVLDCGSAAR